MLPAAGRCFAAPGGEGVRRLRRRRGGVSPTAAARGRPTPFLLFPFEREETGSTVAPAASRCPLAAASGALPRLPPRFIRHRRRFGAIHASKEEKGACWKCLPQYSQTELSAQCAASGGAAFLKLADACHAHRSKRTRDQSPSLCAAGPAGCGRTRKVSAT